MSAVWKFILHPNRTVYEMPAGAKPLCVHEQNGNICLWALVDPDRDLCHRHFYVHGTGHAVDTYHEMRYIGTAHLGPLVFHVFEDMTP